jgi:hypothetical protein
MARGKRHATHEEEFDPEITEGGTDTSHNAGIEHPSLEHFLHETFPEEAPPGGHPPPEEGKLPSLAWIKANFKTKSAAIRWLVSRKRPNSEEPAFSVSSIAKLLGVKYQHVRNVKTTQLKRGPNEDWNLERRKLTEEQGK